MNEWERPTKLGFSYADVRRMDHDQIIRAGLDSGDRLAHELANRLDNALHPATTVQPGPARCHWDDCPHGPDCIHADKS